MQTSETVEIMLVEAVQVDQSINPRVKMSPGTVSRYAKAIKEGARFPPIVVWYDGASYRVIDGFHRLEAHRKAGREKIDVNILECSRSEAITYAAGCNDAHGLPRTNKDKRRAVLLMLDDPECRKLTDAAIAKRIGVSRSAVNHIRREREGKESPSRILGGSSSVVQIGEESIKAIAREILSEVKGLAVLVVREVAAIMVHRLSETLDHPDFDYGDD